MLYNQARQDFIQSLFSLMPDSQTEQKHTFYNDPDIKLVPPESWDAAKPIARKLTEIIGQFLAGAYPDLKPLPAIALDHPRDETHGDYFTNIAFQVAGDVAMPPMTVAQSLSEALTGSPAAASVVGNVEVAKPGFVNIFLKQEVLTGELAAIIKDPENYGKSGILAGKRIMFEYAHPNPFKAFHIGHLRNIILGESLIRLLEANGAEVIRVNYQGDVGMHIAKCLWALKSIDPVSYPKDATARVALIADCYVKGAAAYEVDEAAKREIEAVNKLIYSRTDERVNELWELGKGWSLDKFHEIYQRVYATFVREYMESETLPFIDAEVQRGIAMGVLTKSKGALIFDGAPYGIDTRVYMTGEGLPTYESKQLGLVPNMEFKDFGNIDLLIFNVAVEQISYFKSTIKAIELIHPELADRQYHNPYEFVGLKKGKMSSRKGNIVLGEVILNEAAANIRKILEKRGEIPDTDKRGDLSESEIAELAEVIGVGAIKYSFLNVSPFSYLAFDMKTSLNFEGNSGPYLQYTFARANRIVSDGREAGLYEDLAKDAEKLSAEKLAQLLKDEQEVALLRQLYKFPEVIIEATKHLSPNILCAYLFDLAQRFNLFYKHNPVLKEKDQDLRTARIVLTQAVATIVKRGLDLLGIKTVERM